MNALLARLRRHLSPPPAAGAVRAVAAPTEAWPAGHFYSPIPSAADVAHGLATADDALPGVDLNLEAQKAFLAELEGVYPRLKFPDRKIPGRRYYYQNGSFGALDAVCLAAAAQRFAPQRIIEVGSGHSSAAMLDLRDDALLGGACELTFIDPDFSRLAELVWPGDLARVTLVTAKVQDAGLDRFRALQAGDILFIDSSHVSKIGSDVNHVLFQILPILNSGVVIHVHDVFAAFEYPREWLQEGRHWNEQYLMRAFLMYNSAFEVQFLSGYMFNHFNARFRANLPATIVTGGGQLWLRKK
jgi:hypothetical protein